MQSNMQLILLFHNLNNVLKTRFFPISFHNTFISIFVFMLVKAAFSSGIFLPTIWHNEIVLNNVVTQIMKQILSLRMSSPCEGIMCVEEFW